MEKKTMMRSLETAPRAGNESGVEAERRLRRVGPVTLGLTIPRRWIQDWKARPGAPVKLRRTADGAVVVRLSGPPEVPAVVRISVESEAPDDHLLRHLVAAYIRGAPRISVEQHPRLTPAARQVVHTFLQRTVQTEIVEESPDRIVVEDVTDSEALPFSQLLPRLGAMVLDLHRRAAEALAAPPTVTPIDWERLDDEIDRYAWMTERRVRQRIEQGGAHPDDRWDPVSTLLVARALERVADHAVHLGDAGSRLAEVSLPETVRQVLRDQQAKSIEVLAQALELLHPDAADADRAIDAAEAVRQATGTIQARMVAGDADLSAPPVAEGWVRIFLQSVERTAAYAMDIAEVVLDRDPPGGPSSRPPKRSVGPHPTPPHPKGREGRT
ncbi:MAG: PhoU domain-containing protein [Thermoplasmata archaeon]